MSPGKFSSRWRLVGVLLVGVACGVAAAILTRPWWGGDAVAKKKTAKVYVVQAVYWRYEDRSVPLQESEPAGAGFPKKVFADRERAESYCRRLDRAARKDNHPFTHGRGWGRSFPSLDDYTSMPTDAFIDWLTAQGLNPPAEQKQVWQEHQQRGGQEFDRDSHSAWWSWWYDNSPTWTEAQRQRVWDALDRVRFFEVVEVEAELSPAEPG